MNSQYKKEGSFTSPVLRHYNKNIEKEWFVYFEFKHEGKSYKFKKREGINYYRNVDDRWSAASKLLNEIKSALVFGWNPILDKRRENILSQSLLNTKQFEDESSVSLSRIQQLYIKLLNS